MIAFALLTAGSCTGNADPSQPNHTQPGHPKAESVTEENTNTGQQSNSPRPAPPTDADWESVHALIGERKVQSALDEALLLQERAKASPVSA